MMNLLSVLYSASFSDERHALPFVRNLLLKFGLFKTCWEKTLPGVL